MFKVSLSILFLCVAVVGSAQKSPHGTMPFKDCTLCHSTADWSFTTSSFSHDTTGFVLTGQHSYVKCADCHTDLVFSEARSNCVNCHTDMHAATLGLDCDRCHETNSWLVRNTLELHEESRFPLLGAHKMADCASCHTSASNLIFEPLGAECIDCHRQDYLATTDPNHVQTRFSTNCIDCHKMDAFEWAAGGINHDFFPLIKGHALNDCASCHTNNLTEPLSTDCYSCHQNDYMSTANPSHQSLGFETNCTQCHTIDPDWKPAEFREHDPLFPIYSGKHRGEWNSCTDCHKQPQSYALFSCTDCHEHNRSDMDEEHGGISGYTYSSPSCLACHPTGDSESAFNHNATGFPLKGGHTTAECIDCHASGYAGTSTLCSSCHLTDYNATTDPNHVESQFSTDCASCHTENAWEPSTFSHDATAFPLTGSHTSADCTACHTSGYAGTSTLCSACHQSDFNASTNPNHASIGISNQCDDCHGTGPGWDPALFPNHNDRYALNGAHAAVSANCFLCHEGNYNNTPNSCFGCHSSDYNSTSDPNHATAQFSTDCQTCHTENVWKPSTFDHDNQYFPIYSGRHREEWNSCMDCHTIASNYSLFSCIACHTHNKTDMDSKHREQNGYVYDSANCLACHPTGNSD